MDSVNMGMQRYHDSSSNRSSSILRHPPPLNHRHQNHHVVPPPMQGLRGHNLNLPHVATEPSYRLPTSSSRSTTRNPSQNGLEIGRRQPGPIPQTGFRIYRPHQGVISETALRHHNFSHWRVLGVDVILFLPVFSFYGSLWSIHIEYPSSRSTLLILNSFILSHFFLTIGLRESIVDIWKDKGECRLTLGECYPYILIIITFPFMFADRFGVFI